MQIVSLIIDATAVGLLVGIFYRLGEVTQAVSELRDRVTVLETWRDGLTRRLFHT